MASPSERPAVQRTHPPDAVIRVVNPVMRRLLTSPLHRAVSGQIMLLRYAGRRSGRRFELPVARQEHQNLRAVFTNSAWRHNFRGGHPAELVEEGRAHAVRGTLVEDTPTVTEAYAAMIDDLGWKAAQRRLGIRINVERAPTRDELAEGIASSGLSIVVFEPAGPGARPPV